MEIRTEARTYDHKSPMRISMRDRSIGTWAGGVVESRTV